MASSDMRSPPRSPLLGERSAAQRPSSGRHVATPSSAATVRSPLRIQSPPASLATASLSDSSERINQRTALLSSSTGALPRIAPAGQAAKPPGGLSTVAAATTAAPGGGASISLLDIPANLSSLNRPMSADGGQHVHSSVFKDLAAARQRAEEEKRLAEALAAPQQPAQPNPPGSAQRLRSPGSAPRSRTPNRFQAREPPRTASLGIMAFADGRVPSYKVRGATIVGRDGTTDTAKLAANAEVSAAAATLWQTSDSMSTSQRALLRRRSVMNIWQPKEKRLLELLDNSRFDPETLDEMLNDFRRFADPHSQQIK
jgi:hypothetical protein